MEQIRCNAVELSAVQAQGSGLKTIQLIPDGLVKTAKGNFVLDAVGARLIVKKFEEQGNEVVVDFEHQSIGKNPAPDGLARAGGWIKKLWHEPGRGLLALVGWTEKAADLIRRQEYKYLSPVVTIRQPDNRAIELHNAAITNTPAIVGAEALAASRRDSDTQLALEMKGKTMELVKELKTALGLKDDASDEDVLQAAVAKIKGGSADSVVANSIRTRLALKNDATPAEILIALDSGLTTADQESATAFADDLVKRAVNEFRIGCKDPKRQEWLRTPALSNRQLATEVLDAMRPMVETGQTTPPRESAGERGTIIRTAMRDFKNDASISKVTSCRAFVDDSLRGKGLGKLDETEVKAFSIAV